MGKLLMSLVVSLDNEKNLEFEIPDDQARVLILEGILERDNEGSLYISNQRKYTNLDVEKILIAVEGSE